jgi:TolB protein
MSVGKPGEKLAASAPATVTLQDPVYVGIGVCSHNVANSETAVFSNVRIQQGQQAARPPQQRYRSRINIFDPQTKTAHVIFTADEIWEAPNWSHDGKYLLVNSGGNLFRLPPEGGTPEKLDLGGPYRCNNDHGFTFDGKRLAFSASSATSRVSQVFQAGADGKDVRQMTSAATPSYFHGWSPDGKWLSFVGQRNGKFELYRVAVAGGDEQRLTSHGAYDDGPDYSPDGKWIYFNSDRSGPWDIWRIPADGGGPGDAKAERITSDDLEDWFPHVSPDGKWIVFLSFPKGTANHNGKMEGVRLRMMPAGGGAPQVLTTIFGGQGTINVNSWSPDSKKFAFVTYEPIP